MAFIEWNDLQVIGRKRMASSEISVNSKKSNWGITLNQDVTNLLIAKHINRVSFAQDDTTGEIAMVFSNEGKIKLGTTGGGDNKNYTIHSKSLIERLVKELKLEGEYNIVNISANKSVREDRCFYLIINNK